MPPFVERRLENRRHQFDRRSPRRGGSSALRGLLNDSDALVARAAATALGRYWQRRGRAGIAAGAAVGGRNPAGRYRRPTGVCGSSAGQGQQGGSTGHLRVARWRRTSAAGAPGGHAWHVGLRRQVTGPQARVLTIQ